MRAFGARVDELKMHKQSGQHRAFCMAFHASLVGYLGWNSI